MSGLTPAPIWSEPDTSGFHNSHMDASTTRILRGGSWKKQDMVVLIPAANQISTPVVLSWMNMMYPPNNNAFKVACLGMEVGQAYSSAIESLLTHPQLGGVRFFLTLEHDNMPPPDGLIRLLAHMEANPHLACVGGLYWTKGPGGVPQIWGDVKDPTLNFRPQPPVRGNWEQHGEKSALVECCGTGMGFNLWRTEMFRDARLRKPWFKTTSSLTEGAMTQDLYFWQDARKWGHRCAVACDVLVGHHDHAANNGEGFTW